MYAELESVYYYVTVMNESYVQPPMPEGDDVIPGILQGMYKLRTLGQSGAPKVRLLGSGTILREVEAAAEILVDTHELCVEVWSVTSFTELTREAQDVMRWNMLNPSAEPKKSFVARCLAGDAPVVISSDYMKSLAEPLRSQIGARVEILGTDGFGRSDTREQLRHFFEVDRQFVTLASLWALAQEQKISVDRVEAAQKAMGIDPFKPNPRTH